MSPATLYHVGPAAPLAGAARPVLALATLTPGDRVRIVGRGRCTGEAGTVVAVGRSPFDPATVVADVRTDGGATVRKARHLLRREEVTP